MENLVIKIKKAVAKLSKQDRKVLFTDLASDYAEVLPPGWRASTNAPYYKEIYAKDLMRTLDDWLLHEEKEYKFYCKDLQVTRHTISQRVNQAWLYIINNLDDDEKTYARLKEATEIQKDFDGVRLVRKEGVIGLTPVALDKLEKSTLWKEKLLEFIEYAQDQNVLHLEKLRLRPKDMLLIKSLIDKLPNFFIVTLEYSTIKIARNDALSHDNRQDTTVTVNQA